MPVLSHTKVVASGTLGSGTSPLEGWSVGLNFGNSATDLETLAANAWTEWAAFMGRTSSYIHTSCKLRQVKVSKVADGGLLIGTPSIRTGTVAGVKTTPLHPPQVSLCVSLMTGLRGAHHRGRFYLPMPALDVVDTDYTVMGPSRDDYETSVLTLLRNIRTTFGSSLIVASSAGENTAVTAVRIGRVLDTIRSRRRQLVENYDAGTTL